MFAIVVGMAVDFTSELTIVLDKASLFFEWKYAYKLLVKLTCPIVKTLNWSKICLVTSMMFRYHWITQILEVISKRW